MSWYTHTIFALIFTLIIFQVFNLPASILILALAGLGGLAPDLDARQSKIKHLKVPIGRRRKDYIKPFLPLAGIFHIIFRHRRLMHSLLFIFILIAMAFGIHYFYSVPAFYYIAFLLGYFSHLLVDAMTKSGIMFFYPWKKSIHFLPKSISINTGSINEHLFFAFLILVMALWLKFNPKLLSNLMAI